MAKLRDMPAARSEPEPRQPERTWTPAEADQVRAHIHRCRGRRLAPKVKLKRGPPGPGPARIEPAHPDPLVWTAAFHGAFGTAETPLADQLLRQLLSAVQRDKAAPPDEGTTNAVLAAMHGIAPQDETEALLAAQMVATHHAAMEMLARAVQAEYRHTLLDSGNLAVKLMRTFAAQVEALQRGRRQGQQKVTVEHVHVHAGGQAVVGHVNAGAGRGVGVPEETEEQCHAQQLAHAPEPTLRGADAERGPMPVANGAGQGALPDARRPRRRAEGQS